MFDFRKALEAVLDDPALADVKAPRPKATSSDRLIAIFQEISDFYRKHGRLPNGSPDENSMLHRWLGIIKSEKKIERCRPCDDLGILPPPVNDTVGEPEAAYGRDLTPEEQLDAVLNDPLLADISADSDAGLFDVPDYMRRRLEARREAEYVGRYRPCEDFDKYAEGFREIHAGLKTGKYCLVKFSVRHLKVGGYFVDQGVIGYLAAFEEERSAQGRRDGRTRVIYENGSEADIKFRTITKNLSVDGYSVVNCSEMSQSEFEGCFRLSERDVESGTIYVLRSKSTRPEIAAIKDLYKIGFTVTSVESRIANARNEPTYLCADVEVVAAWKVYNVKSSTFEALIHKLFDAARLNITVDGHRPKEWFIVPLRVIEQAVVGIIKGEPMLYDPHLRQLVFLNSDTG